VTSDLKVRVEAGLKLSSPKIAKAASKALEVDNYEVPKGLKVTCTCRGDELIIKVEHEDPLKVLSTLEDIFTCLQPLMKLNELA